MAMAERPRPGWASHAGSSNNCQDLGNSILLLLGLVVCVNIAVNMVTLVRAGPGRRAMAGGGGGAPAWGHRVLRHPALAQTPRLLTSGVPYCL